MIMGEMPLLSVEHCLFFSVGVCAARAHPANSGKMYTVVYHLSCLPIKSDQIPNLFLQLDLVLQSGICSKIRLLNCSFVY